MTSYTMHEIPEHERPRERLMRHGSDAISTAELIAIILGSGSKGISVMDLSRELILRFGSARCLADVTVEEFCQIKGMGLAKAIQLKAALSLGMRASKRKIRKKQKISVIKDAYLALKEGIEGEKREVLVALFLDTRSYVICQQIISIGTLSNAPIHPREVFYPAIRHKAAGVILAHNHPSGDPTPSEKDIKTTKELILASKTMRIPLFDHLIIGEGRYVSLREKGIDFS